MAPQARLDSCLSESNDATRCGRWRNARQTRVPDLQSWLVLPFTRGCARKKAFCQLSGVNQVANSRVVAL